MQPPQLDGQPGHTVGDLDDDVDDTPVRPRMQLTPTSQSTRPAGRDFSRSCIQSATPR